MKLSIRYKFLIGFLVIFITGFIVLQHFMKVSIEQNIERTISKEFLGLQKETVLYLSESNLSRTSEDFIKNANKTTEELCNKLEIRVIVYSVKGDFLEDSINEAGNLYVPSENSSDDKIPINSKDLTLALKGKGGYTINPVDNMYVVNCSFPVVINNERVGIVRLSKDYTELYNDNYTVLRNMNIAILAILLSICIFSFLFSERLIMPVLKLSEAANEISKGNYSFKIQTKARDEIGQLTSSFINMKDKIQMQIIKISEERDKIVNLEHSRKQFFDNATHELKTPLTVISGYAQILQKKGFEDRIFFERAIKNMQTESERMHELVTQFLYMSKVGSEEMKREFTKINISKVLSETSYDMGIKGLKFNIKMKLDLDENVFIYGDRDSLKQVFINILDNSIKYGDINSFINITLKKLEDQCVITIKDEGIGMVRDKLERIFEPFYRGKATRSDEKGSLGLGLSIVKTIIENHYGLIKIKSKEGNGVQVVLKIPLFDDNLETIL